MRWDIETEVSNSSVSPTLSSSSSRDGGVCNIVVWASRLRVHTLVKNKVSWNLIFISSWGSFPLSLVSVHMPALGLRLLEGYCEKHPTKTEGILQGFPKPFSLPSQATWGALFGLGSCFAYVLGSKDSTPFEVGTGVSASSTPILSACLDSSPIDHQGPR